MRSTRSSTSVVFTALSGFLFDLGVSSPQLDRADRGFSFRNDGPLDMRMDPTSNLTAETIVNSWSQEELTATPAQGQRRTVLGSHRSGDRPAPTDHQDLRARRGRHRSHSGGHETDAAVIPPKRTFQALRIAVNHELDVLEPSLRAALARLVPSGRGVVLTYHSGEDRIVKAVFRQLTESTTPKSLPVPDQPTRYRLLRPVSQTPSIAEQGRNPRSRSARLRAIERTEGVAA